MGGAVPAELVVGGVASIFVTGAPTTGRGANGFVVGAAGASIFGAPNDGKEKGEGFAGLLSVGLGCAEDVPKNREGAEGVVKVIGGNNGFEAEGETFSTGVEAAFDAGKGANGFTMLLGAVDGTEDETPIPANGFDLGAPSFLSSAFSPSGADVDGLTVFACDEMTGINDGMTPTGGLTDGIVVGADVSEGCVLAFSCAALASCMRFRASASACCFCQRVDAALRPPAGTGAGDPIEERARTGPTRPPEEPRAKGLTSLPLSQGEV